MDCLLCHKKIASWRRMTTGSEFCCDEHAAQHKSETVGRLLEYQQESAPHLAEDPIHRLAALGGVDLLRQEEHRGWQMQLHIWVEPRRFSPAKARLHCLSPEQALLAPRLHFPLLPPPRLIWNPAAARVARAETKPAPRLPQQPPPQALPESLTTAVWLWPALRSTRAPGYRPEASAWSRLALPGERPVAVPSRLRPVEPAGLAAAARMQQLNLGLDLSMIEAPPAIRLARATPQLACAASPILQPASAPAGPRLRPGGLHGVQPAQRFIPLAVPPLAARSAAEGALACAEIQSVAPVAWSAAPACENVAFATLRKQPAVFCEVASAAHPPQPQTWRPTAIEICPDRLARRFWLPAPPPARPWGGFAPKPQPVQPAAQPTVLTPVVSADLLIAALDLAPAPCAHHATALAVPALPWFSRAPQAQAAPLTPCSARYSLLPALLAPIVASTSPELTARQRLALPPQLYPGAPALRPLGPPAPLAPCSARLSLLPAAMAPLVAGAPPESPARQRLAPPPQPYLSVPAVHPLRPPTPLSGIGSALGLASGQCVLPLARSVAARAIEPCPPRPRPGTAILPESALTPRSHSTDLRLRRAAAETDIQKLPSRTFDPGGWISLHASAFAGRAVSLRPSLVPAAPPASAHLPIRSGLHAWSAALSPAPADELARPEITASPGRAVPVRLRDPLPHRVIASHPDASCRSIAPQNLAGSFGAPLLGCAPSACNPKPASLGACGLRAPRPPAQAAVTACPAPIRLGALEPKAAPVAATEPPAPAPEFRRPAPAASVESLAMSLPAVRPITPSPAPLDPVERIAIPLDAVAVTPPPANRRPPSPPAVEARAADSPGVREALEQVQRDRAARGALWLRRRKELASLWWVEAVKPALQSKRGKRVAATAASLLCLVLFVRLARAPLATGLRALIEPLREKAYFLLEDNLQNTAAWTNPAFLERRDDGLVEFKNGITLYRPSLSRADYEFVFDGLVRRASLDWVVRAADSKNYYAFKLTRQGRGKDRRSVLIRYPVVNGAPASEKHHVTAMPFDLEENKIYQITVRVFGDRITTLIDDRGVDSFSEPERKLGGVGFFAEPGESALVRSLSISGNDDTQGRMIAWLKGFFEYLGGS